VLVVEDNSDNMTTVLAILKSKYNVITAFNGEDGLKRTAESTPGVILLDISLPGIDGLDVLQQLKNQDATRCIPVIALTARTMVEDRAAVMNAGCDDFLAKPVEPGILISKIDEWIDKSTK